MLNRIDFDHFQDLDMPIFVGKLPFYGNWTQRQTFSSNKQRILSQNWRWHFELEANLKRFLNLTMQSGNLS